MQHRRFTDTTKQPDLRDRDRFFAFTLWGMLWCWAAMACFYQSESHYGVTLTFLDGLSESIQPATLWDPAHEGKPVWIQQTLTPHTPIIDDYIHVPHALKLVRIQERYPWQASQKPIPNQTSTAQMETRIAQVSLGTFYAPQLLKTLLQRQSTEPLRLSKEQLKRKDLEYTTEYLFLRRTPGIDQRGDSRISYRVVPAGVFSLVALQKDQALVPLNEDLPYLMAQGRVPYHDLIQRASKGGTFYLNLWRCIGVGLFWLGCTCLLWPFRSRYLGLPFLNHFPRTLPLLISLPTSLLMLTLTHQHPSLWLLSLMALAWGWICGSFIRWNRES